MPISAQNTPDLLASHSPFAWLFLLTISTPGNPPLRLVNNPEPIMSRGDQYEPYAFAIVLSADTGEKLPTMTIEIDNIAGDIIEAIRGFSDPPHIKVELVSTQFPDLVEKSLDYLKLKSVTYDSIVIQGQMEVVNVLTAAFPNGSYTPSQFPGLFA
jgi:hypothetical protein